MKYKIIIHEILVVYRNIRSLYGGCIYKRVDVMTVYSHNIYIYIYNQHIMKNYYFILHILYFNILHFIDINNICNFSNARWAP
jgi:hypothetical protein